MRVNQHGLSLLDQDKKKEVDIVGCNVSLKESRKGHMEMGLTLTAFGSLEACYLFDLVPLSVEKVDILEAKIRDLEDALQKAPATSVAPYLTFTSTDSTQYNHSVVWNTIETTNERYFEPNRAKNKITIRQAALYHIQMTAHTNGWSNGRETFHLLVDEVRTAQGCTARNGNYYSASLSHIVVVSKQPTKIKLQAGSSYDLMEGSKVSVFLLQGFS
ncbi:unnamed protein product [Aphanomyces euteiches]